MSVSRKDEISGHLQVDSPLARPILGVASERDAPGPH
jgi:hypothetical protein